MTSERIIPTVPGWWWIKHRSMPTQNICVAVFFHHDKNKLYVMAGDDVYPLSDPSPEITWLCPIPAPEALAAQDSTIKALSRKCGELENDREYNAELCRKQAEELKVLRAEIAKLPKTKDGYPIIIGQNLYAVVDSLHDGKPEVVHCGFLTMICDGDFLGGTVRDGNGEEYEVIFSDVYQIEENAAIAVRKAGK